MNGGAARAAATRVTASIPCGVPRFMRPVMLISFGTRSERLLATSARFDQADRAVRSHERLLRRARDARRGDLVDFLELAEQQPPVATQVLHRGQLQRESRTVAEPPDQGHLRAGFHTGEFL